MKLKTPLVVAAPLALALACKAREDGASLQSDSTIPASQITCPSGPIKAVYVQAIGAAAAAHGSDAYVAPFVAEATAKWVAEGKAVALYGGGDHAALVPIVAKKLAAAGGKVHLAETGDQAAVAASLAAKAQALCGRGVESSETVDAASAAKAFNWAALGHEKLTSRGIVEDMTINLEAQSTEGAAQAKLLREANQLPRAIRFVHYNIKELTTAKLVGNEPQIAQAAKVLRSLSPDLLSINEVQYDLPNVPTQGLPGTGKNMERLVQLIQLPTWTAFDTNLSPANTGKRAKKKPDGNYMTEPNAPGSQDLVDQVSFGIFPGQYSTGFAANRQAASRVVVTDLDWQDWDPELNFAALKLPNGQPLPTPMELFDKNFNDVIFQIDGKELHVITFHTVPAFGFGGSAEMNIARNAAQLSFLEWYLTGHCDSQSPSKIRRCQGTVRPLSADVSFVAVGDLNVDLTSTSAGAGVLKRMFANERVHDFKAQNFDPAFRKDGDKSYITYASDGVDLGKLQSQLDYFIVSKDIAIEYGRVVAPVSGYKEHACFDTKPKAEQKKATLTPPAGADISVSTRYQDDGSRKYCVVQVSKEWTQFRKGSDHLPVYVTLRL